VQTNWPDLTRWAQAGGVYLQICYWLLVGWIQADPNVKQVRLASGNHLQLRIVYPVFIHMHKLAFTFKVLQHV
jgi:hypothetical protein